MHTMTQNAESPSLETLFLNGSPRCMGESFGKQKREAIHELAEIRFHDAQKFCVDYGKQPWKEDDLWQLIRECLTVAEAWDRDAYEEFLGIARGADMEPERLFLMQGLTDLRDHMFFSGRAEAEGCSSFIIDRERTKEGHVLIGQNWDLQTSNLDFILLVQRRPTNAPETISLTLAGCLSLIGMNSEGVAIGNTNLLTSDTRPGIHYLFLIHRVLRCKNIAEVTPVMESAPRIGGHYYYVADASGRGVGFECTARKVSLLHPEEGRLVHCNHILASDLQSLEVSLASDSTCFRQKRLDTLIASQKASIQQDDLRCFLSDHEGGEANQAICRHHVPPDISTNACVIMSPETRAFHACRSQAHVGRWSDLFFSVQDERWIS